MSSFSVGSEGVGLGIPPTLVMVEIASELLHKEPLRSSLTLIASLDLTVSVVGHSGVIPLGLAYGQGDGCMGGWCHPRDTLDVARSRT